MTPIALRKLRRRLGLTQVAFAKLLGVTSNTYARWERGEMEMREPTRRLLLFLAKDAEDPESYGNYLAVVGGTRTRRKKR